MQVKLLRVIQERKVRKVGSTQEEMVDVRIVSATHQKLAAGVAEGRFRQDLLYRLNVIDVHMPSLRDCPDDIPVLAAAIVARLAGVAGRAETPVLSAGALASLSGYDFPGNVRELENVLERALALTAGDLIVPDDLRLTPLIEESAGRDTMSGALGGALAKGMSLQTYLDEMERIAVNEALAQAGHNRTAAARLLGITFRSLRYRLQRLGIE
jgi:two-component system response regulator PilR (NtrC family)